MLARNAKKQLVGARLAVAIALMSANFAWAQTPRQPVQGVDMRVTGENDTNPSAIGSVQTGPGTGINEAGAESRPTRGIELRLSVGNGYDDNVFRTESNTDDDFFWSIRPSLVFNGGLDRHRYRLGYNGDYVRHFEFSDEDFNDHRLFGDASFDVTRKLDFNIDGEMLWGHDPRGAPGTCIVCSPELDTWRSHRAGAELVIGRTISRAQIIPALAFSGIRYTNNNQSDRDFDRQDYRLRARYRISPRFWVIGDGGYAVINHLDPSNTLDRTEFDLLGGIGWEATAKTSGEVLVGTLIQDFESPTQPSGTNFNWLVRVFWEPRTYSKVTLFTRRRSQEDASGGIGSFLADTFGVAWRHGFTESLVMGTGVDYTIAQYDTGRDDDYVVFGIELSYELNRWLDVSAEYRYENRRSNIPGIDYDDNTVLLKLTTGLYHGF